jgi:hypothetical protein
MHARALPLACMPARLFAFSDLEAVWPVPMEWKESLYPLASAAPCCVVSHGTKPGTEEACTLVQLILFVLGDRAARDDKTLHGFAEFRSRLTAQWLDI